MATATPGPAPLAPPTLPDTPAPSALQLAWQGIQARILGGLVLILPILITFWLLHWLYSMLEQYVIDPIAQVVLFKAQWAQAEHPLPVWFEFYVAPVLAIAIILAVLYLLGFLVNSTIRQRFDALLLRVPGVSVVYDGLRSAVGNLQKPASGPQKAMKMVLVPFPHPGTKVPAFVTATCRDIATQRVLVCVYVPTTPVPASGFFLLVPEEDITELNWSVEETLQAVISGGLTTPANVCYYKAAISQITAAAAPAFSATPDGPRP